MSNIEYITQDGIRVLINADPDAVLGGPEHRAVFEILCNGGMPVYRATEQHSSENGTPIDIWHNRIVYHSEQLSQGATVLADLNNIRELADDTAALVLREQAGLSIEWDGSNNVGRLSEDAEEARDAINEILTGARWSSETRQAWDVGEWLGSSSLADVAEIIGAAADEDEAMAALDEQARSDGAALYGDLEAWADGKAWDAVERGDVLESDSPWLLGVYEKVRGEWAEQQDDED